MADERRSQTGCCVVKVTDLIAYYDRRPVNRKVSFVLRAGELGLLVGGNGSGKTSVLRAILGEVSYAGRVSVSDMPPPLGKPWQLTRNCVRVIPQSPVLPQFLTVHQYLHAWTASLPAQSNDSGRRNGCDSEVERRVCQNIKIEPECQIGKLSFGQQRLLDTLLAFEARPQLVLADEPLAGVSASNVPMVVSAVQRFVNNGGAVLMVIHLPERDHWSPQWAIEIVAVE